ncbi:hypothetical protein A7982_13844 [Minicystis rosea]|nr:hypothetical protein A7982_13844 [Minicystis rosea]
MISQLELVAFFARNGTLPWWADSARPRLLDETVEQLLQRAARPLTALTRELERERGALPRLVRHCSDAQLGALFDALVASSQSDLPSMPVELEALLSAHRAVGGATPDRFRACVWTGALRAACVEESPSEGQVDFWREVLARIALEAGVPLESLLSQLHAALGPPPSTWPGLLGAAGQSLRTTALEALVQRPDIVVESPVRVTPVEASSDGDALGESPNATHLETLGQSPDAVVENPVRASSDGDALGQNPSTTHLETLGQSPGATHLETLDQSPSAVVERPIGATQAEAEASSDWQALDQSPNAIHPATLGQSPNAIHPATLGQSPNAANPEMRGHSSDIIVERPVREMRAKKPSRDRKATTAKEALSIDPAYSDTDEVYVDNAGLVVLWPFIGHLFERLGLLNDSQLKDQYALHRAAGLLQHLCTGELELAEYQLPLARVLSGLRMTEVFDFGPPVTEAEAEECHHLLTAAIASAPILGEMSIAGFRGSFLVRKGALSACDGAWLLRVERASHDVVLDRFPWGMSWVKQPWMEAPLRVEW